MEEGSHWQILVLVLSFIISSLYTMCEAAFIALSKLRLRSMQDAGVSGAEIVAKVKSDPDRFLTAMLIGANLFYIIATSMAAIIAQNIFQDFGVAIAAGIMTFVTLIFGDITPKSLAVRHSDAISLKLAPFALLSIYIFSPIIPVITFITRRLVRLFGGEVGSPTVTESEIKTLVEVGHEEGVIVEEEKNMIDNVFEFRDTSAWDVMIPRTDIVACQADTSYDDIYKIFVEEGYSRMPVYEESIDQIVGILNFRDFILSERESFDIKALIREPFFTYESKLTTALLSTMREQRFSIAVVLDEYGGTSGLLTRNDIVEEIMGFIGDEYDDPEEEEIKELSEGRYSVLGQTSLEDVAEHFDISLESEDFETIGGFVTGLFGEIPEEGEVTSYNNLEFIVESMDKNRIEKLTITISQPEKAQGANGAEQIGSDNS